MHYSACSQAYHCHSVILLALSVTSLNSSNNLSKYIIYPIADYYSKRRKKGIDFPLCPWKSGTTYPLPSSFIRSFVLFSLWVFWANYWIWRILQNPPDLQVVPEERHFCVRTVSCKQQRGPAYHILFLLSISTYVEIELRSQEVGDLKR